MLNELNEKQKEAVKAGIDESVLVISPAGSGKTTVIENRYAHLVKNNVDPRGIVVVTFTKSMARELIERLRSRKLPIEEQNIGTIHAFCYRVMREFSDKSTQLIKHWEKMSILSDAIRGCPYAHTLEKWHELDKAISLLKFYCVAIGDEKSFLIANGFNKGEADAIAWMRQYFSENIGSKITFNDMPYGLELNMIKNPRFKKYLQGRYKHVIVDEGQDTSFQAIRILATISSQNNPIYQRWFPGKLDINYVGEPDESARLFIVGDPNQSIFRFAGARPEVFMSLPKLLKMKVVYMNKNYRSTKKIVKYSHACSVNNYKDFYKEHDDGDFHIPEISPFEGAIEGVDVRVKRYSSQMEESESIAREIGMEMIKGGKPCDYLIMVRVRSQLAKLEIALSEKNIPFVNLSHSVFWERKHVSAVLNYLRLALYDCIMQDEPQLSLEIENFYEDYSDSFVSIKGIPSIDFVMKKEYKGFRPVSRDFIALCNNKYSGIDRAMKKSWWFRYCGEDIKSIVEPAKEMIRSGSPTSEVVRFITQRSVGKWAKFDMAEDGDLSSLSDDLNAVESTAEEHPDPLKFLEKIKNLIRKAKAENKIKESVIVDTVHKIKGMERKTAYLIGVNDGILPHENSQEIWDERCVFYVAISRPKYELRLSHCESLGDPSIFIEELEG